MASDKKEGLLPQNTQLPIPNGRLQVNRLVSSGATSEVYEGVLLDHDRQPRVAVKAMKPLEFAKAREFFFNEALTLAKLPQHEQETNSLFGLPPQFRIAPEFFGRSDHDGVAFLIMGWLDGRQIPDLLAQSTHDRLPEQQALVAGFHLFRMLDLLHTKLGKSYIDLKLENLWWEGSVTDGQLRLSDFGTMESIEQGDDHGVRRDLIVASAYLCKMLTGYMPDHVAGELRDQVVPAIQRSDFISWGARQLLSWLLHPNASERPRTARDVLIPPRLPNQQDIAAQVGLMDLADYWSARHSPEKLASMKDTTWERALATEGNPRLILLSRSRALLDIWKRRASGVDPQRVVEEEHRLDELLQQSGVLENGRALFSSGSYSQAEALFAQGRRQSYEPARIALFRRWIYLAQMGHDPIVTLADGHKRDLERVVKYLGERNWGAASRQMADLRPALGQAVAFARLEADLQLYQALDAADAARHNGDFAAAVAAYDRALAALDRLAGDRDDILRNETGQLRPERERLDALAKEKAGKTAGQEMMRQAKVLLGEGRQDEALIAVRRALVIETFNLDDRLDELTTLTDSALRAGDYKLAAALAALALDVPAPGNPLLSRYRLANALRDAERALEAGDVALFLERTNVAAEATKDTSYLKPLLEKAQAQAQTSYDALTLRTVANMKALDDNLRAGLLATADELDRNWRGKADAATREQHERLYPAVDNLLSEAGRYLYLAQPAGRGRPDFPGWSREKHLHYLVEKGSALKEAHAQVDQAEAKSREAGGYHREEIQRLRTRVERALQAWGADLSTAREAAQRNTQQANDALASLGGMATALATPVAPGDTDAQLQTARDLLMGSRWYLTVVDPEQKDVKLWAEQAATRIDYLRPQEWAEVQQLAADRLEAFRVAFEQAEEIFQTGELARGDQSLNVFLAPYEATDEYQAFAEKFTHAAEWYRFSDSFEQWPPTSYRAGDLAALRRRLPFSLPAAFWSRSTVAAWLDKTREAAAAEAKRAMGQIRQPFYSSAATTGVAPSSGSYSGAWPSDSMTHRYGTTAGGLSAPSESLAPAEREYGSTGGARTDQTPTTRSAGTNDPHGTPARNAPRPMGSYPPAPAGGPLAYLELLKWWFDAAATRRLAALPGEAPSGSGEWNAGDFLKNAARAAMNDDAAALEQVVEGGPLPADIDRALEQLTVERWREAIQRIGVVTRQPEDGGQKLTRPPWLRWAIIGGGIAAILLLLLILGYTFREDIVALISGPLDATPTVTAELTPTPAVPVSPTSALGAVVESTPVLAIISPTLTLSPTVAPMITPTIAPTLTPTIAAAPPEASNFHIADPAQLVPPPPVAGATLWRMPPTEVQPSLESGAWQTETGEAPGEFHFIEDFTNPVSLIWAHDQPLSAGLYQLYALDTTTHSLGSQTFEVFLDGQSVEPVRGVRVARFNYSDAGQTEPAWLPIGAYQVTDGQRLSVRATADPTRGVSFAVPSLLVARLADRERDILLGLPEPSLGRPLMAVLDDDRIDLFNSNANGTQYFSPSSRWPAQPVETAEGQPPVWNGRYNATKLVSGIDHTLRAEWRPLGRLPAGEYQIFVYVPAGSNAVVNYELLADGGPVDEAIITNTRQREFAGQWVDVGIWTLPQEAAVGVRATSLGNENRSFYASETEWTLGVDAVALLRVGE